MTPEMTEAANARIQLLRKQANAAATSGDFALKEQATREWVSLLGMVRGPDAPDTFLARAGHAVMLAQLDQPNAAAEAQSIFDQCRSALGPDHEATFHTRRTLANTLNICGFPLKAVEESRAASERAVAVFGPRSTVGLLAHTTYAQSLASVGHFRECFAMCDELSAALKSFAAPDKRILDSIDLAHRTALVVAGRYQEAVDASARQAEQMAAKFGTDHPDFHLLRVAHARLVNYLGDPHTAAAEARQAADVFARRLGPDHSRTLMAYAVESSALCALGRPDEAAQAAQYAYEHLLWCWGRPNPAALQAGQALAEALLAGGRAREALGLARILADQAPHVIGPAHPRSMTARFVAAQAMIASGDPIQGRNTHEAVLADRIRTLGSEHPHTKTSERTLAALPGSRP